MENRFIFQEHERKQTQSTQYKIKEFREVINLLIEFQMQNAEAYWI